MCASLYVHMTIHLYIHLYWNSCWTIYYVTTPLSIFHFMWMFGSTGWHFAPSNKHKAPALPLGHTSSLHVAYSIKLFDPFNLAHDSTTFWRNFAPLAMPEICNLQCLHRRRNFLILSVVFCYSVSQSCVMHTPYCAQDSCAQRGTEVCTYASHLLLMQ